MISLSAATRPCCARTFNRAVSWHIKWELTELTAVTFVVASVRKVSPVRVCVCVKGERGLLETGHTEAMLSKMHGHNIVYRRNPVAELRYLTQLNTQNNYPSCATTDTPAAPHSDAI